jgi:hypothetical protein
MTARFGIDTSILVRLATGNPEHGHMKTDAETQES